MDEWNELLDANAYEMEIASAGYEMMGRMLDHRAVISRLKENELTEFYIYGGGYLGIQLYQAVYNEINVISIVDKNAGLVIDLPNIPVLGLEEFENQYAGQHVVITPAKFYIPIKKYLSRFVPEERILCLGELIGGVL